MRPTDLRIRITRQNSLTSAHNDSLLAPPSPLLPSAGASSPSFVMSPEIKSPLLEDETPPCTPPCNGTFLLPPGFNGLGVGPTSRRGGLLRRNSSLSSVGSSVGDLEEESEEEWTEEEKDKLRLAFDSFVSNNQANAPFSEAGPPPSNLTHIVARSIIEGADSRTKSSTRTTRRRQQPSTRENEDVNMEGSSDGGEDGKKWKHGLKSTRMKILALVKERQSGVESTPMQADPEATPRHHAPLVRQGSMDFLPAARNVGIVARLGSALHRAEQNAPPPLSRSSYSGPSRVRMQRTPSLSSIAGSPSVQRPTPSRAVSSKMTRISSDTTGSSASAYDPPRSAGPPSSGGSSLFALTFADAPSSMTPKRPATTSSGLGSAFTSPGLGAYPSPVSLKKKAKFTHHSPSSSIEGPEALGIGLGLGFGQTAPPPAASSNDKRTSPAKRLSPTPAVNFYLAGDDQSTSSSSISSLDSHHSDACSTEYSSSHQSAASFFPRSSLHPSSSMSSMSSMSSIDTARCGTPSPLSSAFDLNELSLDGLEEEHDIRMAKSPAEDYWAAGVDAQELRERLGTWGWARQ